MQKGSRFFTFLVIPSATSRVRRFSVPFNYLYAGAGLIGLAFVIFALGMLRLTQNEALNLKYQSIKAQNEELKKDNEVFQNSYARLRTQIAYVQDVSKELAREAKMEPPAEIDQQVGTGGPEKVASMDKGADMLERQVRLIGDQMRTDQLRMASVPSGLPVNGYQTDGFGLRRSPFGESSREFHEGMDLAVDFGTSVACTADGIVIWAGPYSGYGNLVAIYHSNGVTTRYGHLSRISVETGQHVKRGDQVGYAGSTGRSTGPHVHYEIRENDQPVDPSRYLDQARK